MRPCSGVLFGAALVVLGAGHAAAVPAPCVGGTAGGVYPCNKVDMLANIPLTAIGGVAGGNGNDVWGWTDPANGKEYAIIGLNNGTSFVDISDPVNPVFVGLLPAPPSGACVPSVTSDPLTTKFAAFVPNHDECPSPPWGPAPVPHAGFTPQHCNSNSLWRDHEVYADHAYIGSEQGGHGLVVFDLRLLRNVTTPPVTFTQTARYCGFGSSHTISVNTTTGFVYANGSNTCNGGPHIVDVTTPGVPVFAGCDSADDYTHDSQCLTYQGPDATHQGKSICINSNGPDQNLIIKDVTNPATPLLISKSTYAGAGYPHQGWITPDHRYFLLDDEFDETSSNHNTRTYIWNLTDLDAPVMMAFHQHATPSIDHQQFIHGNLAYQSNYSAGLRILETKDIAAALLTEVGFFDVFPSDDRRDFVGTWANYPFYRSGIVAITTMEPGIGFFTLRPLFADLAVTVTDAPDPVALGDNVTYTFTVRNQGPTWSSNTTFTDTVPTDMTFVSATPSQGSCAGTTVVTCSLGTLQNGDVATVVIVARADALGTVSNTGSASADETDTRLADNSATAETLVATASPVALAVDAGGNGVFQANEGAVTVEPTWRNVGTSAITLAGAASAFTGPAGPTYTTVDGTGAYPPLAPNDAAPCSDCYAFSIDATARPLVHWDTTFEETLTPSATTKTWVLHVGDSFTDVPSSNGFYRFVETILHNNVTVGCTGTEYCPTASTTREAMAAFVLVSNAPGGTPPPNCVAGAETFTDVPAGSPFCRWIEELFRRGVVTGCGANLYCPASPATREQMAVFVLRTLDPALVPPACVAGSERFDDVPAGSGFCPWIEELERRGVVTGCTTTSYCPGADVTREQMSVFLAVTFGLLLYGV